MRVLKAWKAWMRLLCLPALGSPAADPVADWGRFEKQVRDQALPEDSLRAAFPAIWSALRGPDTAGPGFPRPDPPWVFPIAGYSLASVGKGGYRPDIRYGGSPIKGYDFFDGNRHGGHPAYDIFIRDRNRDSRDDGTGKPVPVVAPVDLIVLSTETAWEPGSGLRGGKYLWAMAVPSRSRSRSLPGLLLYFSHLDSVGARPGDTVAAGLPLGTVGRTGTNAHAERSPTHLHFMTLRVTGGRPGAFDPYPFLAKAVPHAKALPVSIPAYRHHKVGRIMEPPGGRRERMVQRITLEPGGKCGYSRWSEAEVAAGRFESTPASTMADYLGDCAMHRDTLKSELRFLTGSFPNRAPDTLIHLSVLVRESTLVDPEKRTVYRPAPPIPAGLKARGDIYTLSICREDAVCRVLADRLLLDAAHFPDSLIAAARRDESSYRRALRRLEKVLAGPLDAEYRSRFQDGKRAVLAVEGPRARDVAWRALIGILGKTAAPGGPR